MCTFSDKVHLMRKKQQWQRIGDWFHRFLCFCLQLGSILDCSFHRKQIAAGIRNIISIIFLQWML